MDIKELNSLTQSLLLAIILSSGLIASACSAESSNTSVFSNQSTPSETYELGLAYYEGDSVPEDDDKAFELFQAAADQGYAPAEHYLGLMYHDGLGTEKDYQKAFEWYKKAADQGNQEASNRIGKLVIDGKIDNKGIVIYSTEDTGLTLGDIEK